MKNSAELCHNISNRVVHNHNKADGYERRLALYLTENFKYSFDMEGCVTPIFLPDGICNNAFSYVYATQVMQAETLASAYRLWRRNWKGRGKEYTAGALVWQVRTRNSPAPK